MNALSQTGNERIVPGGNLPPDVIAFNSIDAFYDEARNWASDGFAIENQAQADEIDTLDKALLKLGQEADAIRIEEKRPLDEQIDAIQSKFNPYIQKGKGKVDMARSTLKSLLTTWRNEQARIKAEAADKARREADEERRKAEEAIRASSGDLEAREKAEEQLSFAKQAEKFAAKTEKAATTNTGLRTSYDAVLIHGPTAISHYWKAQPQAFIDLVQTLADREVRAGKREIPGFRVDTVKGA